MNFKLLTIALAVLLGAESVFVLAYHRPPNRFRTVDSYDGFVAFDSASGQLCKTIVTKTAKEIAREAEDADGKAVEAAKTADIKHQEEEKIAQEDATRTRKPSPDDYISEAIAAIGSPDNPARSTADTSAEDTKAEAEEFVATLPACKDVR